jgi:hypothetical protein
VLDVLDVVVRAFGRRCPFSVSPSPNGRLVIELRSATFYEPSHDITHRQAGPGLLPLRTLLHGSRGDTIDTLLSYQAAKARRLCCAAAKCSNQTDLHLTFIDLIRPTGLRQRPSLTSMPLATDQKVGGRVSQGGSVPDARARSTRVVGSPAVHYVSTP